MGVMGRGTGMTDAEQDRAEIYDLFNRYADAVAGREWMLLDEVFTEDVSSNWPGPAAIEGRKALVRRIRDVIERASETHVLGNYTATIDGDVAEASVRVRVRGIGARDPSRLPRKILGFFRARLVRTRKGWRFRQFGSARYAKLDAVVSGMGSTGRRMMVVAGAA
jgi:hypothetical protein